MVLSEDGCQREPTGHGRSTAIFADVRGQECRGRIAGLTVKFNPENSVGRRPCFAAMGFTFSNPWIQSGHKHKLDMNVPPP